VEVNTSHSYHNINTLGTLSLERLVTFETFTANFQEEGEQIIDQQKAKGKDLDEVF
jgi:hypothetical protein